MVEKMYDCMCHLDSGGADCGLTYELSYQVPEKTICIDMGKDGAVRYINIEDLYDFVVAVEKEQQREAKEIEEISKRIYDVVEEETDRLVREMWNPPGAEEVEEIEEDEKSIVEESTTCYLVSFPSGCESLIRAEGFTVDRNGSLILWVNFDAVATYSADRWISCVKDGSLHE